jgi:nicotinamide-nucleotide amidase
MSRPAGGRPPPDTAVLARRIIALLAERQLSVAVAESLTGGLVCAALTAVPGASMVFRGGVIAYATELKAGLLGVPASLLDDRGAVHPDIAEAMAAGARARLAAEVAVATTGVAGPDPADGKPPGTVHIAVSAGTRGAVRSLALAGGRDEIRGQTVAQCLSLLWAVLTEEGV